MEQASMGSPRSINRSESDIEFDRASRERGEVRCFNVSPFTARIEIATVPGSEPRRIRLEPGESALVQHGYAVDTVSVNRTPLRPTIEMMTEREAWAGKRTIVDGKEQWSMNPGPRLPMVVSEERAKEVKAQWEAAMTQKIAAESAPLRIKLERADGSHVEVQADVQPSPPRGPSVDGSGNPIDPAEDQDDLEPAVLPPAAPAPTPSPTVTAAKSAITKGTR